MMNRTDVATFQPFYGGSPPAGVVPNDRQARKRPWIESFSSSSPNYSPSSSLHHFSASSLYAPSRLTKTNKSKGSGFKSSTQHEQLTEASIRISQNAAAADAAVTSTDAAATASDELGAFRQQAAETGWNHPILPEPSSYGVGPSVSDTRSGSRDHFSLSSLSQSQGSNGYDWSCHNSGSSSSTILPIPMPVYHSTSSYPTIQGNSHFEPSSTVYPPNYQSITTYTFYPSLPPFDVVNTQAMGGGQQYPAGYDTSGQGRRPYSPGPSYLAMPEERLTLDWPAVSQLGPDLSSGNTLALPGRGLREPVDSHRMGEAGMDEILLSSPPEDHSQSSSNGENRRTADRTRKLKACIRCRMQKIKCLPDPEDAEGENCLTCRKINLESKKVIHKLPCLRWKITEVVLFREGGLNLTKRWTGVKMKDLRPQDWASDQIRTIKITIGYRREPLVLRVRKFKPNNTDITWKNWVDSKGTKRTIQIEPYALADIWKTAREYDNYVYHYASLAVFEYSQDPKVDRTVRDTYEAALNYVKSLDKRPFHSMKGDVDVSRFFYQYFRLWFATRNTIGTAYIEGTEKDELLDMKPVADEECPYIGKILIPRMIPAQFDSLGYETQLTPLRKQVLEGLWKMMAGKNPDHFFAVYLVVFMLLHEVPVISADRMRRAKDEKEKHRYNLASFVEKLQQGANIILSHWHYYKRNVNVSTMDSESENRKPLWGNLSHNERQLMVETSLAYKNQEEQNSKPMTWEHDLYFVSQMFEENWLPKKTFSW
ncbi:hypothetical protein GGR54DRAFT_619657 [Hypoxylon sp. NC1633]|nr:hypothetical protein GGR54DRAFT_619657 [Hypoxylon sp. NC1633]